MVAVGHVRHNDKSIHCLNHSGGDNHRERAARCGDLKSSLERHLCWHSDPSLDGERHNDDRCRFHLRPHGERDSSRCAVASCDVSTLFPEMVENRHQQVTMSVSFESQPSQAIYSGCLLDIPVYWAILHLMYWYCIGMGILHTGPPNIPIKPGVKYIGSLP
jgi:hypothetical protein